MGQVVKSARRVRHDDRTAPVQGGFQEQSGTGSASRDCAVQAIAARHGAHPGREACGPRVCLTVLNPNMVCRMNRAKLKSVSRAAIYQLFRHIPNADDAAIDAAVDALADQDALRMELQGMKAGLRLVHRMIGILVAFHLGTLWMLFGVVERLNSLETTVQAPG